MSGSGRALRSLILLAGLVVLIFAAAGCTTERTLDRETLEGELRDQLLPEHPGLISAVSCPEIDEPMPGDGFLCSAQLGVQAIRIDVEIGGTEDALESVAIVTDRLVATGEIAQLLSKTFGDEIGIQTEVDCGQPVSAIGDGETIRCDATDPTGLVRSFDVTLDANGELDLRIR